MGCQGSRLHSILNNSYIVWQLVESEPGLKTAEFDRHIPALHQGSHSTAPCFKKKRRGANIIGRLGCFDFSISPVYCAVASHQARPQNSRCSLSCCSNGGVFQSVRSNALLVAVNVRLRADLCTSAKHIAICSLWACCTFDAGKAKPISSSVGTCVGDRGFWNGTHTLRNRCYLNSKCLER